MSRKRRYGLFLFIMLLWSQLVFGTGLAIWRYWLIKSENFDIFFGRYPAVHTDRLIEDVRLHCSADLQILYVGTNEPNAFYVKYQMFPRIVTVLNRTGLRNPLADEILRRVEKGLAEGRGSCLMIDEIELNIPLAHEQFDVNERQSILVFRGDE